MPEAQTELRRGSVYAVKVSGALRHSLNLKKKEGRLNRQREHSLLVMCRAEWCLFKKTVKGNHPVQTILGTNWPERSPIMTSRNYFDACTSGLCGSGATAVACGEAKVPGLETAESTLAYTPLREGDGIISKDR